MKAFAFLVSFFVFALSATKTAVAQSEPYVVVHHIVGNTYPYTQSNWYNDIVLAASKGVDAFALNVGSDSWQPGQIASAYAAAEQFGSGFKLFISLDMSSLPCSSTADIALVQSYITDYNSHPNQLKYNGAALLSTFSGESCTFGNGGGLNAAWEGVVKNGMPPTFFIPSFFVDPGTFGGLSVMDGGFNWNGGWPMCDCDISFSSDQTYITDLGGRPYMAPVSPWFFTHYSPQTYNKNWIYDFNDWLFAERWELLIANRGSIAIAEVITWNDYGESHYVGPIEGAQPNSQAWVDGFEHQAWLDLMAYYIPAFKTGNYPAIDADKVWLWSRLYPAAASSPDPVPQPTDWQWATDTLWAVATLTEPATVTLTCGSASSTTNVGGGLSKLQLAFPDEDCNVSATVVRNGQTTVDLAPSNYTYSLNPPSYNFNAFVVASD